MPVWPVHRVEFPRSGRGRRGGHSWTGSFWPASTACWGRWVEAGRHSDGREETDDDRHGLAADPTPVPLPRYPDEFGCDWLPETYGPVDFDDPRQMAVLDLLGVRSLRETSRADMTPAWLRRL